MLSLDVTPQSISDRIFIPVELSAYSLSLATTVLSSVIIVIQILMVSRVPGTSCQLRIAMEIIIESALLYSISALVYTSRLASETTVTSAYNVYADLFFGHMAVMSHPSFLPVLVF